MIHYTMSTSFFQERFSDQISNARGIGLFCSVDVKSTEHRDKLMGDMKAKGEFTFFFNLFLFIRISVHTTLWLERCQLIFQWLPVLKLLLF